MCLVNMCMDEYRPPAPPGAFLAYGHDLFFVYMITKVMNVFLVCALPAHDRLDLKSRCM